MSDFRIQYVQGSIAAGVTQQALNAPDWFQQIGSLSSAFIVPATTVNQTVGISFQAGSTEMRDWCLNCDINTTTQILLNRATAVNQCEFAFYIVEYIGVPGGPNEFIMRGRRVVPFPVGADEVFSNPISDIVDLTRCVPFINGRHNTTITNGLRHFLADGFVTNNAGSNVIRLRRVLTSNGEPTYVCYCVEFTGTNWTVQHGFDFNFQQNQNKVTPLSPTVVAGKSWLYEHFTPGNRDTPAGQTHYSWISGGTQVRTRVTEVNTISSLRFWVISNIDPRFAVSTINVVDGAADLSPTGTFQFRNIDVSPMQLNGTLVTGHLGATGANATTDNPASCWRVSRISTTQVQVYRVRSVGTSEYIIQSVMFPSDTETGIFVSPTRAQLSLLGRIPNAPVGRTPAPAQLLFSALPPFSTITRNPGTATLALAGLQPITTRLFPGVASLAFENGVISQEREKIIVIPMPDLTYTGTPNNPPTVTVGGGVAPGVATLTLSTLTHQATEGGNIAIRSPATSGLVFAGQFSVIGLEGALPGLAALAGLAPEIVGTETTIEPGVAALALVIAPFDPSFVAIPYQWIDVEPAPVVQWR
jgi:hypothetical protein